MFDIYHPNTNQLYHVLCMKIMQSITLALESGKKLLWLNQSSCWRFWLMPTKWLTPNNFPNFIPKYFYCNQVQRLCKTVNVWMRSKHVVDIIVKERTWNLYGSSDGSWSITMTSQQLDLSRLIRWFLQLLTQQWICNLEKSGSDCKVHHNRMSHFRFNFNFDNYSRQQHVAQQPEFVCKKGAKSD